MEIVKLEGVSKVFKSGEEIINAVDDLSLVINRGEFVAVVGPSGSGKTTLLNIISGIEKPDEGKVFFLGHRIDTLPENKLSELRLNKMGFIFQTYNLIPTLTAKENAEFILFLQGVPASERERRIREIFDFLGISELLDRFPKQMSGGQQQRVAIARAVVGKPEIVLADEPTANLDSENSKKVISLMKKLNKEMGITFIFSTHDPLIMESAERIIHLRDGKILKEERKD